MFYFTAYGLKIGSAIFFPELVEEEPCSADIQIRYGEVPLFLADSQFKAVDCEIAPNQVLLRFKGIANYWVLNGSEIIIEPYPSAKESDIRFYVLGFIMALILHQRKFLVLHASAIRIAGGCVAFIAPSGYGKSTLAAAFYQRGFSIVTDDVCALLVSADERPRLQASFPQLKLNSTSIAKLNISYESLTPLLKKEKYALSTETTFNQDAQSLLHIYELVQAEVDEIRQIPLSGIEKFNALKEHSSHHWTLAALGLQKSHFLLCAALHKQVSLSQLVRPTEGFQLDELVNFLLKDFETFRHSHRKGLKK